MAKRKVNNSELLALLAETENNNDKKMSIDESERNAEGNSSAKRPNLPPLTGEAILDKKGVKQGQKIPIPRNRIKPLKDNWMSIYTPIVEQLKLQIMYDTKTSHVQVRTSKETTDAL